MDLFKVIVQPRIQLSPLCLLLQNTKDAILKLVFMNFL